MRRKAISIRSGTEGPRHDPYDFDEITVRNYNGITTYHFGLAEFIEHISPTGRKLRIDQGHHFPGRCKTAFERLTGMHPKRAFKTLADCEEKKLMLCYREHAKTCKGTFECVEGYPGETLEVCKACGKISPYYSFDRSAIE